MLERYFKNKSAKSPKFRFARIALCLTLLTCPAMAEDNLEANNQLNSDIEENTVAMLLPAAGPISESTLAARKRYLGVTELDPTKVQLWWVGVSSFVMNLAGHLVLLDAWEVTGFHKNYVPIDREGLAALRPEVIFIGHGHFDHAADAGYVAAKSGATLVAGNTVCERARRRAIEYDLEPTFTCINLGEKNTPAPGEVRRLKLWKELPAVGVIKHRHSAASLNDKLEGGRTQWYAPSFSPFYRNANNDWAKFTRFLGTLLDDGGLGEPNGGTWAYWFKAGELDLFWNDSSGPMQLDNAEAEAVKASVKSFGCADVHLASIVGFGLLTSGYRDALAYVESARPKILLPTHHDAFFPLIGGGAKAYEESWTRAINELKQPPEQDYLRDPEDYLTERSFSINDTRWVGCGKEY